jgi:hypothetical protein
MEMLSAFKSARSIQYSTEPSLVHGTKVQHASRALGTTLKTQREIDLGSGNLH